MADRQRNIFLNGVWGNRPRIPADFSALATAAESKLSREAFAYLAGGAGRESTVRANADGWRQFQIIPRMLRDVAERDLSVDLFGRTLPGPFLLAPIGVLELAHPGADLAVARAAARVGVPMVISSQASFSTEEIVAEMGDAPRWFQLYWSKSDELTESFVRRAEAAKCEAIVVTLDTTLLGWRSRDLDLAYLPFLRAKGIAQYASDPVFRALMREPAETDALPKKRLSLEAIRLVRDLLGSYPRRKQGMSLGETLQAVRTFIRIFSRPSLRWEELAFLRERTKLPILLKGILHPDDARRALDHGVDGLIVSNHGGRQVDGAISSVEALPAIVEAVADRVPILLDSGVRGGSDALKALAIGARAVCVGRPYAYALAVAGEEGVEALLRNFLTDFSLTLGLAGYRSVGDLGREAIAFPD